MYDIIIKNGTVIDGTAAPRYYADIAIKDGKIAKIAPKIDAEAKREIDASGLIVSPGFIDAHTHSDSALFSPSSTGYNHLEDGATTEICPAPIDERALQKVQKATLEGFAALRLSSYARFDYILDTAGELWCLEANTLPGMTPTSLLPQEAAAVGMDYDTLCDTLARSAINKK